MVHIELVDNAQDAHRLAQVFAEIWGEKNSISVDVIVAIVHSGGYASLAEIGSNGARQIVGGSLGLVGRENNKLHSHVTGVVANFANSGIGTALKQHQWSWAKEKRFAAISWTFDPLVRRNAHFNLLTLGAKVVSYHRDFYGKLGDSINGDDNTDRLVVERQVENCAVAPSAGPITALPGDQLIATPEDIVSLRQSDDLADRELAKKSRMLQRQSFETAFADSKFVRGFTSDGSYVLTAKVR